MNSSVNSQLSSNSQHFDSLVEAKVRQILGDLNLLYGVKKLQGQLMTNQASLPPKPHPPFQAPVLLSSDPQSSNSPQGPQGSSLHQSSDPSGQNRNRVSFLQNPNLASTSKGQSNLPHSLSSNKANCSSNNSNESSDSDYSKDKDDSECLDIPLGSVHWPKGI